MLSSCTGRLHSAAPGPSDCENASEFLLEGGHADPFRVRKVGDCSHARLVSTTAMLPNASPHQRRNRQQGPDGGEESRCYNHLLARCPSSRR